MPALLAALTAKLAGLGTLAKTVVATVAAFTMAVAVGTAAVLPGNSGDAGVVAQGAVQPATTAMGEAADPVPPPEPGETDVEAAGGASTPTAGSTSAKAAAVAPTAGAANLPAGAALPTSPAVPACVADLIPSAGATPDPAELIAELPACIVSVVTQHLPLETIQSLIGSANLPVDVSNCLSAVVSSLPGFSSGDISGLSQLLLSCMPTGFGPGTGWDFGSGTGWDFETSSSGPDSSFGTSSTSSSGSRRGSRSGR